MSERILGGDDAAIDAWLRVPRGVDLAERLAVHIEGYPARVAAALREAFPAVAHILGEGSTASLARRFGPRISASLRNLNDIGAALPEFLESDPLAEDLPFLPDLARLEWAVVSCFHSEVPRPFDPRTGEHWTLDEWEQVRIAFQPGLAVVRSAWPIRELREAKDTDRAAIDIDLVDRPDRVLVARQGFEVVVQSIDAVECEALVGLRAGRRLGDVAEELTGGGAELEAVSSLFSRWAARGLVVSCALSAFGGSRGTPCVAAPSRPSKYGRFPDSPF